MSTEKAILKINGIFIPQAESASVRLLEYCDNCNSRYNYWCGKNNHKKVERPNIPFIIPDLKITYLGKWVRLTSEKMNKKYDMSQSKFQEVVLGCGVKPGGNIPDQWWMISNVGGSLTLKWLGSKSGDYLPQD